MTMPAPSILVGQHYSRFLAEATAEYNRRLLGEYDVSIKVYADAPCEGAATLVTVGICDHDAIHQEILLTVWDQHLDEDMLLLFEALATQVLASHTPLPAGSVLPPAGPIVEGCDMEAFYITQPTYFDAEFADVLAPERYVQIRWLIPIYRREAEWISRCGDEKFERILAGQNPDLLDLRRSELKLPRRCA